MKPILEEAVNFLQQGGSAPASDELVEALLAAEKQGKVRYDYSQLLGPWRLGFITGTQKTRQRASGILGAGRFLPRWLNIQLAYSAEDAAAGRGLVQNSVKVGPFSIQLTGPTQFYAKTNSLAFDFTQMQLRLGGLTFYDGFVRDGERRESQFYQQSLKEQAFFTYFWVESAAIAARGRGSGLALWVRD